MDTKLFIALSTTHGSMQSQFLPGVMDYFKDRPVPTVVMQYIDPYIILARNSAACDFLYSDCTHLMFIDADIMFVAEHIKRLLENDVDIVGGLYCKKAQGKIQWVGNALPNRPEPNERGLLPMKHLGTGFLMVKRGVLEKMLEVYSKEMDYLEAEIDRQRWDFFPMRIVDRRMISEDWFFCNRARELGYTIYADTKVILKHIGLAVYPLESQVAETHKREIYEGNSAELGTDGGGSDRPCAKGEPADRMVACAYRGD
jgi:hypothetical protein